MSELPWSIYDELIDNIPDTITVRDCVVGVHWVAICSTGMGLAMTIIDNERSTSYTGSIVGSSLKRIAELAKSWNNIEASIGVAAINSYYNSIEIIEKNWGRQTFNESNDNVFDEMLPDLANKRVAVIGHFPALDAVSKIANLSILERNPQKGDFPDPSCEYILPEQDFVFITGVTFTNKTLPRLLTLSKKVKCILVGPSVPLTPVLLSKGVSVLAGTVVLDELVVLQNIKEGGDRSIFKNGAKMIRFRRESRAGQ
jgi:uncharacterized protein